MALQTCSHPAALAALSILRDKKTQPALFRSTTTHLGRLVVNEATCDFVPVASRPPVLVPVLRAGVALLEGALSIWPKAEVGFVGVHRDEETLAPSLYLDKIGDTTDRDVVILEPMLATGGSLVEVLRSVYANGSPRSVTIAGILCAPPGVAAVSAAFPEAGMWFVHQDPGLDERGFISPGLGDAGDRAWGR